jgi:hypothetical protein
MNKKCTEVNCSCTPEQISEALEVARDPFDLMEMLEDLKRLPLKDAPWGAQQLLQNCQQLLELEAYQSTIISGWLFDALEPLRTGAAEEEPDAVEPPQTIVPEFIVNAVEEEIQRLEDEILEFLDDIGVIELRDEEGATGYIRPTIVYTRNEAGVERLDLDAPANEDEDEDDEEE